MNWDEVNATLIKMANYLDSHPEAKAKIDAWIEDANRIMDIVRRDVSSGLDLPEDYLDEKLAELDAIIDSTLKGKE